MKRFLPPLPLSLLLLSLLPPALPAAAPADDPPVDVAEILQMLEAIRDKGIANRQSARDRVIKEFQSAAGSGPAAVTFYEHAIMATRFKGQSRESGQLREWREREAGKLKSKAFQSALRAHLHYLALSLRQGSGAKLEDLIAPLAEYCGFVWNARGDADFENELNNPNGLLKKPIRESLFVQWYQIAAYLPGEEKWEQSPGNLDGIFDKAILPIWRENKDPRAITYWDQRIAREEERSRGSKRTFDAERFAKITKPGLLWQRAQEYPPLGQRNRAIREMLAVIKSYPDHPEFERWVESLLNLLKGGTEPDGLVP